MKKRIRAIALAVMAVVFLSAAIGCGRKAKPEPRTSHIHIYSIYTT